MPPQPVAPWGRKASGPNFADRRAAASELRFLSPSFQLAGTFSPSLPFSFVRPRRSCIYASLSPAGKSAAARCAPSDISVRSPLSEIIISPKLIFLFFVLSVRTSHCFISFPQLSAICLLLSRDSLSLSFSLFPSLYVSRWRATQFARRAWLCLTRPRIDTAARPTLHAATN